MTLLQCLNKCLLPKLAKNFEESDDHAEFNLRVNLLNSNFHQLMKLLGDIDFRVRPEYNHELSTLFILNLELQSDGPWLRDKCKNCSDRLNHTFQLLYGFNLDNLLKHDEIFKTQEVFDNCIEDLHKKLTTNDFKKYPALIDVYIKIVVNIQAYKIVLNPMTVLPISLLLIDDFMLKNKIKGLECCMTILECLTAADFCNGNYYEVIYSSLKKCITEKDKEATKLTLSCLLKLLNILPDNIKVNKTDETYYCILDQINSETNLYRKAICFSFTKNIIEIHGVNCVKRKIFITLVCDALDVCTQAAVEEILLQDVLECLQTWLKHCWCIWKLSKHHKLLSTVLKMFYVAHEETNRLILQNLIKTLIALSTKEEQKLIYKQLEMFQQNNKINPEFLESLETIKTSISV